MGTKKKAHRKSKAALAAVAGTVAATAAYRRRQARTAGTPNE